jgi:hypothetical protein
MLRRVLVCPLIAAIAAAAAVGATACYEAPVERPENRVTQTWSSRVEQRDEIDLLFVIDDSPSMRPKQEALRARFASLMEPLAALAARGAPSKLHIGVITTDLGAGPETIRASAGGCAPGGRGARLVARGPGDPTCLGPVGKAYIEWDQTRTDASGAPASNLPSGRTLQETFSCIAAVGDKGCGFEQPLEAARKAIHDRDDIPDNAGFFRDDAILVVVFVTDEDDCSAPATTDLFGAASTATGLQDSFRCVRYGVMTGTPPSLVPLGATNGPLADARPATADVGGKLVDVQTYIDFFTRSRREGGATAGGADDVILARFSAPEAPFQTIVGRENINGIHPACPVEGGAGCKPLVQRSCAEHGLFGDPAVRLNAVVHALPSRVESSICAADYTPALADIAQRIYEKRLPACLTAPLDDPARPECVVTEEVPEGGQLVSRALPACDASGGPAPCWRVAEDRRCRPICDAPGGAPRYQAIEIVRTAPAVPGTIQRVSCSTRATPPSGSRDPLNPLGCAL